MGTIPVFPTFTPGEIPPASKLNSMKAVSDFWALTPRCYAWQATAQPGLATATTTVITLDQEVMDVGNNYDGGGDVQAHDPTGAIFASSRIYVRTAGKYEIAGQVQFATNATGRRQAEIRLNAAGSGAGGTRIGLNSQGAVSGGVTSVGIIPFEMPLVAGDYIEMFGYQDSGGSLAPFSGNQGFTFLRLKLTGS